MSSALALGAVSAVLRNILDNGLIDGGVAIGQPVKVTAVAPDLVKLDEASPQPRLNLFLYRVTPNPAWRNAGLPTRSSDGSRVGEDPLALDLHYLLTSYGTNDFEAEVLLGYGMHLLHQWSWLDREAVRKALSLSAPDPMILPDAFRTSGGAGLADQVDAVKVTLEPTDTEEISRLWSALQAHYRPTATYRVSVVVIEAAEPVRTPLPVLSIGGVNPATGRDRGVVAAQSPVPSVPAVDTVDVPSGQAAQPGESVTLRGHDLAGSGVRIRFVHRLPGIVREVEVGDNPDPAAIQVTLPASPPPEQDWPAGVWSVDAVLRRPGESATRTTNVAPLLLAPVPGLPPAAISRDSGTGQVTIDLAVTPRVRPEQPVRLAMGDREAAGVVAEDPARPVRFVFPSLAAGEQWVRLTVDGVQSQLVDRTVRPPVFRPDRRLTVPP